MKKEKGYYKVKFYNHEEIKLMFFNGTHFESFRGDTGINDEIEFYEKLDVQASQLEPLVIKKNGGLQVGDEIEVNSSCEYYGEWKDIKCKITGIRIKENGKLDFTIKDETTEYDGFSESELTKVAIFSV